MLITPIQIKSSSTNILVKKNVGEFYSSGEKLANTKVNRKTAHPKEKTKDKEKYKEKKKDKEIHKDKERGTEFDKVSITDVKKESCGDTDSQGVPDNDVVMEKAPNQESEKRDWLTKKKVLSEILKEYEQLSKDKTLLAVEIRNMKKYLADVRSKLDQSLIILNRNTTLFAMTKGLSGKLIKHELLEKPRNTKKKRRPTKKKVPTVVCPQPMFREIPQ